MTISDIDKTYIYDCTKTQSSSMTWYEQRIARVSSSTIHRIYKTSLEKPSKSLLLQTCNPSTTDLKVPSIVWGREHEKQAILEFKDTLSTMHQDFTVTDSGFLIDTVYPFIELVLIPLQTVHAMEKVLWRSSVHTSTGTAHMRNTLPTQTVVYMTKINLILLIHTTVKYSYRCMFMTQSFVVSLYGVKHFL
ncbi:unnamed protein product [Mytilus edulis]|uniref:Uncharacterized protein n=1 Tax=Mytilus edulis TaxID=6550 RepID=A0A8S3TQY9_MYTED|nr:unnamed protein product [Mytilus edulis]